jgi:hypothetical protein
MKIHHCTLLCLLVTFLLHQQLFAQQSTTSSYQPRAYTCTYLGTGKSINVDGDITESAWQDAVWTDLFADIEGSKKPKPYLDTKAKMLWDDEYFYIAAEMQETHIWATFDKQDMVIFQENNFEVFIDPDGDTHHYLELEINAIGTIWDLILTKPYSLFGTPISAYDIKGLKKGVKLYGTNNNASDKDEKWTIELAIPWSAIGEISHKRGKPIDGDFWKVNFSRVQWDRDIKSGKYYKQKDAASQKDKPENNWVWSPQGVISMHNPETWGLVIFAKSPNEKLIKSALEVDNIKMQLRKIFLHQQTFYAKHSIYTTTLPADLKQTDFEIRVLGDTFTAKYCKSRICYYIREDGRVWEKKP